jgi:hypothetical protein
MSLRGFATRRGDCFRAGPKEVRTTTNGGVGMLFAPRWFSEDRCVDGQLAVTANTERSREGRNR